MQENAGEMQEKNGEFLILGGGKQDLQALGALFGQVEGTNGG